MQTSYTYQLTPSVSGELDAILAYISGNLHASDSAIALLDAITEALELACAFPESNPLITDPLLAMRGYRRIVVGNYIIIYTIDNSKSVLPVVRIVYGAMDYLKDL
ncbi:MAG: type II toxin-antitoxin system RelE/ParE family toxin [Clostridia bacterium]|nr:type II toxin-antitoxin system RelE/ParE family toxin [Clostridia bacterium]